jgi:hypothetical protein
LNEEQIARGGIDIIAIHGINGDYQTTWTDGQNNAMWLRDFFDLTTASTSQTF